MWSFVGSFCIRGSAVTNLSVRPICGDKPSTLPVFFSSTFRLVCPPRLSGPSVHIPLQTNILAKAAAPTHLALWRPVSFALDCSSPRAAIHQFHGVQSASVQPPTRPPAQCLHPRTGALCYVFVSWHPPPSPPCVIKKGGELPWRRRMEGR